MKPIALLVAVALALAAAVPGCVFLDVKEQQEKLQAACTIKGTARSAREGNRTLVVVLLRRAEGESKLAGGWDFVSQFVIEDAGRFKFGVAGGKGVYTVGAFDDANRNLTLDPDESFVIEKDPVTCAPGAHFEDFVLNVPAASERRAAGLPAPLPAGSLKAQVSATLGQLTAIGELTSLAEDMFHQEVAESGLWRPFDFLVEGHAGIWFLEPYDPRRIPVLFVHGINGTPANFQDLIRNLDHKRFQAWVYYYPSGLHMGTVADHLNQTVIKLQVRYGVKRFAVVAHSMGGLVARGFIQRHYASSRSTEIPLFVSISTPWGGHQAASGVKNAPVAVEVWHDMAPGSEYQRDIFGRALPPGMQHHLLFTFQRNSSSFGQSDDQGVSVASQLARVAQKNAARTYGFDDTHMGVLRDPEVSALLNDLLARAFYP